MWVTRIDDVEKYMNNMAKYKHKCACGHNVYLSEKHPKTICSWCRRAVYLHKKDEFKEKLKNALKN